MRSEIEEKRKDRELQNAIASGAHETRDGKRIYRSPDGKRAGIVPRTVADKINFSQIIYNQLDRCGEAAANIEGNQAFLSSVIATLQYMPEIDQDKEFKEDVRKATYKVRIPTGRYGGFGGSTYEIYDEGTEYDAHMILRAIIDLLRRRGLFETAKLWDENQVEVFWKREGQNPPVQREDEVIEDAKE